jgi:ubiquinone/menaquinone biosynthesis C-methylase UbiE
LVGYRNEWNKRAKENPKLYILGDNSDEATFDKTGTLYAVELLKGLDEDVRGWIVLDIGCGIGRIEKHLSRCVKEVYGVDVSDVMIKEAIYRLRGLMNVYLSVSNGKDLGGFDDCMFNLAFSIGVFQHIPRSVVYKAYFPEVNRVLRPGGYFVFTVPYRRTLFSKPLVLLKTITYGYLIERRRPSVNIPEGEPYQNDFFSTRFYGKRELETQLKENGFRSAVMQRKLLPYSDQLWITARK